MDLHVLDDQCNVSIATKTHLDDPLPADLATDPTAPFCFLMDASMLGVGVGFDTKGAGTINVVAPSSAGGLEVGT